MFGLCPNPHPREHSPYQVQCILFKRLLNYHASLLLRMRRHSALSLQATGQATGYKFVRNAAARTAFALTQWKSNMQENSHRVAQSSLDYEKGEVAIANANLRVINYRLTQSYFLRRSNMNKEI